MKPPAFQFYASDFLVGTIAMSPDAVGAYIRLLCHQWDAGSLPDDDAALRRLGGCNGKALAQVRQKFERGDDGQLRNKRLESERAKQQEFRERQAANGAKRWPGNAKPHPKPTGPAMPGYMPNACSPSPSPSSCINPSDPPPARRSRDPLFDALARSCGSDPTGMTKTAARTCAVKLAEIRKASPDVTPAEIERRAKAYRAKHPDWSLTPAALCSHWAEFPATPVHFGSQPASQLPEPPGWQHWIDTNLVETCVYRTGGDQQAKSWRLLPRDAQQLVSDGMRKSA